MEKNRLGLCWRSDFPGELPLIEEESSVMLEGPRRRPRGKKVSSPEARPRQHPWVMRCRAAGWEKDHNFKHGNLLSHLG